MKFKLLKCLPLVLLFSACGDDFLNERPYGAVTEETLAANLKGCDALLIAAYSSLDGFSGWDNGNPWGAAASNWTYGSIAGGDAYKGSEANDQPDIIPIENHSIDPNNPYLESKWRTCYDGIARANVALRAFTNLPNIDDALRAQRVAECRFLRGFYHFEAKRVFGKVPYIDETVTDYRVPNDRDIYGQIETDLAAAAAVLPTVQSEIGRATKGAAQALLGKALIYQGKYSEAKTQFDLVINSGVYSLTPGYHDNFNAVTRNNSEGVLVVQQAVNEGTEGDNGNIGDVLNYTHGGGPGGCCGFHQPSQNFVNAFKVDANGLPLLDTYNDSDVPNDDGINAADPFTPTTMALDPRLDWTVGRRGVPYLDWGVHPGSSWIRLQAYGGPYSPKKLVYYRGQEGSLTSASGWTKGYTANNVKLIRYSDVLLMAAECEVEIGSLEKAREYVNQIRTRAANPTTWVKTDAGANAANYVIGLYTNPWTDKDVARKAVRFERRLELGMEGHRFFDLVRWGIAAQEKNAYFAAERDNRSHLNGAGFTAGKNEVYPIPARAITLSSLNGTPTLTQNPGY
jgi:starch-binding outer membrane protein, SusD/RagB family